MLMLGTDVTLTLTVLVPYLVAFSCAMWSVFPVEEYYANPQDPFEILMFTWSLLMMTFNGGTTVRLAGEALDMPEVISTDWRIRDNPETAVRMTVCSRLMLMVLFFFFLLLSVVLLLNLLVAAMSETYGRTKEESRQLWRYQLAPATSPTPAHPLPIPAHPIPIPSPSHPHPIPIPSHLRFSRLFAS